MQSQVVIFTGPTATGKTEQALRLCKLYKNIEIINADSLQIYRKFNIGTAKPSPKELSEIKHHLIDIRDPTEPFTAADFVRETKKTLEKIHSARKRALIVGGCGFYLKALLYGLWDTNGGDPKFRESLENHSNQELYDKLSKKDPLTAKKSSLKDRYRLIRSLEIIEAGQLPSELKAQHTKEPDPCFKLWVLDRPDLGVRICTRTQAMLQAGFVEEVKGLRQIDPHLHALKSVGYRQVCQYIDQIAPKGRKRPFDPEGLRSEIELATRQLIKRQRTWFGGQKKSFCFELDRDLSKLESEFKRVYGEF